MRASAKGIGYPSNLSGSNPGQPAEPAQLAHGRGAAWTDESRRRDEGATSDRGGKAARIAALREPARRANMICGGRSAGPVPPGPLAPAPFLTTENPNGCLCHQRLSLDTPI